MNMLGKLFNVLIYGESHQKAIGVVIDGMPSGILINEEIIKEDINRRRPSNIEGTSRKEEDKYVITSGVFNGYSTGSPIHITIPNLDVKSKDYENLVKHPRPNHADFVSIKKYKNFHDYRGGGRFSGRLTLPMVIAGSIAKQIIPYKFETKIKQIGNLENIEKIDDYLELVKKKGDTVGGVLEITISNMDIGIGEPLFDKLDARLSHAIMSVPAVKGVVFGNGFFDTSLYGTEFNDLIIDEHGKTKTNYSGGVVGGISNGNDLIINVFVKPISSVAKKQETFNLKTNKIEELEIKGRHDVSILRRIDVVLENMCAVVLADLFLENKARL